jgi:hypothetical protein
MEVSTILPLFPENVYLYNPNVNLTFLTASTWTNMTGHINA